MRELSQIQLDRMYQLATLAKVEAAGVKSRMSGRGGLSVEEKSIVELAKGIDLISDAIRILVNLEEFAK